MHYKKKELGIDKKLFLKYLVLDNFLSCFLRMEEIGGEERDLVLQIYATLKYFHTSMTSILMVHYCVYCLLQYKIKFHKIACMCIYLRLFSGNSNFYKNKLLKNFCMYVWLPVDV